MKKIKKPIYKRTWSIVLVIFIILGAVFGGRDESSDVTANAVGEKKSETITNKQDDKSDAKVADDELEEVDKSDNNVSEEFKNALKKGRQYSDTMNMSKIGIFNQLTSEYGEKFPTEAGQYAIDNLDTDYNENALSKAKSYSDTMKMSKSGIFDQLTSEYGEQFTSDEAQYAIDNLKVNYKENALSKAKDYQKTMSMSKEAIREQLTSEYGEQFTQDEADYAIENLE